MFDNDSFELSFYAYKLLRVEAEIKKIEEERKEATYHPSLFILHGFGVRIKRLEEERGEARGRMFLLFKKDGDSQ